MSSYRMNDGLNSINSIIDTNILMIEYIDFAFKVMDIDITYEKFKDLNAEEKKSLLTSLKRDSKLNKIL